MSHYQHTEERMELKHDPVPGFRLAFNIAITVGLAYLIIILMFTL